MGHMTDQARAALALEILESSDTLHEFEDSVTLRVHLDLWEEFIGREECDHVFERDEAMINVCTECGVEGEQA